MALGMNGDHVSSGAKNGRLQLNTTCGAPDRGARTCREWTCREWKAGLREHRPVRRSATVAH